MQSICVESYVSTGSPVSLKSVFWVFHAKKICLKTRCRNLYWIINRFIHVAQ